MSPTVVLHLKPRRFAAPSLSGPAVHGLDTQVESETLLRGRREVLIRHAGETYRLRHTRNGKLILTK